MKRKKEWTYSRGKISVEHGQGNDCQMWERRVASRSWSAHECLARRTTMIHIVFPESKVIILPLVHIRSNSSQFIDISLIPNSNTVGQHANNTFSTRFVFLSQYIMKLKILTNSPYSLITSDISINC